MPASRTTPRCIAPPPSIGDDPAVSARALPILAAVCGVLIAIAAGACAGGGRDRGGEDTAPASGDGEAGSVFARHPYLARVTETTARLRWIARAGARVRVVAITPEGATVRAQRGDFRDLRPGTRHRWIATVDGVPAAEGSFTTAPLDLSQPLDLIAFGDTGAGNTSSRAVARLAAGEEARMLLSAGDNAYPFLAPRFLDDRIFGPLAPVLGRMPNIGALGDHDILLPAGRAALVEAFEWPGGGERYALRHGPLQVVVLGLEADAADLAFARRAFARRGPLARIVLVHRPLQPGNPLLPLIRRARVTAVVAGHLHAYERRTAAGAPTTPMFTVGTGGAPRNPDRTPRSDDADVHIPAFGLLRIRLHGGSAEYAFVDTDGAVRDRFTAPLRP
jgi:hypothetical protein